MKSLIASLFFIGLAAAAQAADHRPCADDMTKGEQCSCKLGELHPTQPDVGMAHVDRILDKARSDAKKGRHGNTAAEVLRHHAEEKPTTVLIGPERRLFIVDGHHHAVALFREVGADGTTTCMVGENDAPVTLDSGRFWHWMDMNRHARLRGVTDPTGQKLVAKLPPDTLGGLGDDPYRSLASFVENACDAEMTGDYVQFDWADLLRNKAAAPGGPDDADKMGRDAAKELWKRVKGTDQEAEFLRLQASDKVRNCAQG